MSNEHQANDQYMMEHGCLLRYLKDKNDVLLSNDESLSACRFLWWMQDSSPEDIAEVMLDGYHWAFHKPVPVLDIVNAHNDLLADEGATMMQAEADRLAAEEPDDYGVLLGPEDEEE
jgi:hypothetical protein